MVSVINDAVIVSSATTEAPIPLSHSRIGYQTYTDTGTLTASSSEFGFSAISAGNKLTYEYWKPSSLPAYLLLDIGDSQPVDYVGIAAHTLGSNICTVLIEHSQNNVDWTTVSEKQFSDAGNRPVMFFFDEVSARYWRVTVQTSAAENPLIGVLYVGQALAMERMIYGGHAPITLNRETVMRPNVTEGGQWVGRSIIRQGYKTTASYKNITPAWYRQKFDPFVKAARSNPFFFAWRPDMYPEEVGFAWTGGDISPTNSGVQAFMDVSISMSGYGFD